MTSRMPFRPNDDEARAAVGSLLGEMRAELLVMPRETVVGEHLQMMAFEEQLLATPRFVKPRAALPRPRRAAYVFACVSATIASCGLSAAGALPEPLQRLTDTIARTLGVPEPHAVEPAPEVSDDALEPAAAPRVTPTPQATPPPPTTKPVTPKAVPPTKPLKARPTTTTPRPSTGPNVTPPPHTAPRPVDPKPRVIPKGEAKPPSNNSQNTPPGYPTDWREYAIAAAGWQMQWCAQASTLEPADCPQLATAAGATAVQWRLLNDPLDGAAVVASSKVTQDQWGNPSRTTTVTVYERFQMEASYTTDAGTTAVAYSSGIGQATMRWNGSSFVDVSFAGGSAAGQLLPGVTIPSFVRPAAATDASVLTAVQTAFNDCITAAATNPSATCPQFPADAQLNGDPTQGAVVTFDAEQGTFGVTGTYALTSDPAAIHAYTATLYYDGQAVRVLGIAGA